MKKLWLYLLLFPLQLSVKAQSTTAEDYYVSAFNEMWDMLAGRDSLSIKRAVFLAEWAYYEGKLDYKTDFCDEIDRIKRFILSLYAVNKLHTYNLHLVLIALLYPLSSYAYYPLSPYSYCGGNPVSCIDPTGEDIVVLNYGNDVGHQHLAMLIQNEDGKWQYYSVNGNNMYFSGSHSGGRTFNDVAVGLWDSPQEFLYSPYNTRNEHSKDNKSMNHFGFSEGYHIPTTPKQDEIMRNNFIEKAKTHYTPLGNNCATIVQEVMSEAGIPVAMPKYKTIHIPENKYFGEPGYDIVKPNINSWPSTAFKSIMKTNPGGKYFHK